MIQKIEERYLGNVYTTDELADFVAKIIVEEYFSNRKITKNMELNILDPSCGDGVLLMAINNILYDNKNIISLDRVNLMGLDIDAVAIEHLQNRFLRAKFNGHDVGRLNLKAIDTLLPIKDKNVADYWIKELGEIDIIIANPPWGADKVYNNQELSDAGYTLNKGQFDSYVLFIEMCVKILSNNGVGIFILPDSLFLGENKELREYLLKNTEIKILARLGEKLFPDVNRATSIVMIKKNNNISKNTFTRCFRLDTKKRNLVLSGNKRLYDLLNQESHQVKQSRFLDSTNFEFDIDIKEADEEIIDKLKQNSINWKKMFDFSRGVEISKEGKLVECNHCNTWQGYKKNQKDIGKKFCGTCKKLIDMSSANYDKIICNENELGFVKILVGENICRYNIYDNRYIKLGVKGIDYKKESIYCKPKILIRKTGLGINSTLDYKYSLVTQTVYMCTLKPQYESLPLEYFLGVLNSRVMLYYYVKKFGENEWKSHPYLTKEIIFALPVKKITQENQSLVYQISNKVRRILDEGYSREIDFEVEELVVKLYNLDRDQTERIINEINSLPDLEAFRNMKYEQIGKQSSNK